MTATMAGMTQTSAPPTATEPAEQAKPKTKRIVLFTAGLGALVILTIIGTMLPKSDPIDPAAKPMMTIPAAGYVSDAALAAWWTDSGSVPPSVLAVTKSVSWNGVALVAETSLSGASAKTAATSVCSALSAYGLTHGGFLPVQVLGSTGGVLVSRRSEAEACTWRG